MVDLLGMFRRRPAKRPGFARSREDITALGEPFGDMLSNPVRDAPPIARDSSGGVMPPVDPTTRTPHPPGPNKARPAAKPPSPKTTLRTMLESGTHIMITSQLRARVAKSGATTAPSASSSRMRSGTTS